MSASTVLLILIGVFWAAGYVIAALALIALLVVAGNALFGAGLGRWFGRANDERKQTE